MDESQWLACGQPALMLAELHVRFSRTTLKRKIRLFICGGCRQIPGLLTKDARRHAVEIAELYADGIATKEERDEVRWALGSQYYRHLGPTLSFVDQVAACSGGSNRELRTTAERVSSAVVDLRTQARFGSSFRMEIAEQWKRVRAEERKRVCDLLRCIFGNPFRPTRIDAAWLTGTVVQVANAIYQGRRWEEMGVLADTLEESGCKDEEVLSHCRGQGPHAKGCHVVDALLGKA